MSDKKIILLAEDNPNDRELILAALAEHDLAGDVVTVGDGAETLDYLRRQGPYANRKNGDPAVILLDIRMPRVDGLEVLREIKADAALKSIPVVILTESREERTMVESYRLGVDAYIVKQVKPVQFQQFLELLLRTRTGGPTRIILE